MRQQRNTHSPAFTLIEILVVISVISLLIAILMPALKSARAAGRQMKCLSTTRQLGLATHMYLGDYDGWHLPIYVEPPSNKTFWYQNRDFRHYIGISKPDTSGGAHFPIRFICPEATLALDTDNWEPEGHVRIDESYGFNDTRLDDLRGQPDGEDWGYAYYGVRVDEVSAPSQVLQLADAINHTIDRSHADDWLGSDEATDIPGHRRATAYRHPNEATSVIFFDGHGESLSRSVVGDNATNRPLWLIQ